MTSHAPQRLSPVVLDPTARDLHGEAARLRELGPAVPVELPGRVCVWAITTPDLIKSLFTDPRVSKMTAHWTAWQQGEIPEGWPLMFFVAVHNMFTADGDEHRRLREIVQAAFNRKNTTALTAGIETITRTIIDELEQGPVNVDLRERFTLPIPLDVICDLMGAPTGIRPDLRRAVANMFDASLPPHEAIDSRNRLYTVLAELVQSKRDTPGDDLVSALIAKRDHADRLSEKELLDTLTLLFAAGHETTANLLDNTITALLTHPDYLDAVQTGHTTWEAVIEEVLRWDPPVATIPMRYATEDIEVDTDHGPIVIPRGDAILAHLAATARDPRVHGPDAHTFNPRRTNTTHITFGHGPHHCLGAQLARLEAAIALRAIFTAFPRMQLAVSASDLQPQPTLVGNGHQTLPVTLRP